NSSSTQEIIPQSTLPPDGLDGESENGLTAKSLANQQALAALTSLQSRQPLTLSQTRPTTNHASFQTANPRASLMTLVAIAVIFVGLVLNNYLIGLLGTLLALLLSIFVLWPWLQTVVTEFISPQERSIFVACL
ncbi:hypothetical protein AAHH59_10765, partial [Pediococcus acidilactici]|uniref:hypothetical protein n=1 Tax=Pediococcus acidilactici TaxID=1254 RepID=UPI003188C133